MHSPGPSPFDIQTHLYNSFLQASTYDVALRISGSWSAVYKLHRVVLIQSGFFRSLFTAGFSESAVKLVTLHNGTDEISVVFDDLNITRPAFEVCVSRLYGGGPPLYISPNLISTTNHPLTPPFSNAAVPEDIPADHHPATPRFLQSLLATAIYLSIPSVASQALSLILKTIGPTTVLQYLNFACGKTVDLYPQQALHEPQAAVGLEHVAQLLNQDDTLPKSTQGVKSESSNDGKHEEESDELSHRVAGSSVSSDGEVDEHTQHHDGPSPHYGMISNKIGEACSCWLVRWAFDMLQFETHGETDLPSNSPDGRIRSKSVSYMTSTIASSSAPLRTSPLWGRRGLSARWIAAIISADTLFVKNERERYDFARSVVELRRRDGILDFEETIWATMFERGIYYSNMTFEDLLTISQDISPTTKKPYVALAVLQASQWSQSVLRHLLTSRPNNFNNYSNSSSTSPPPREKELGVTKTTTDILSTISDENANHLNERAKVYFPVLSDASFRIGDTAAMPNSNSTGTPLSMEELFNPPQDPPQRHPKAQGHDLTNAIKVSPSEETFFGILTPSLLASACVDSDPVALMRWSPYPPYRFSVEFWDVDLLKEKSRLHSQTIWHAGNLFNVYVQIVRKKGQAQLGIYLHRQSNVDPIPASSAPYIIHHRQGINDSGFVGSLGRSSHLRQPSLPSLVSATHISSARAHYSPSIHPSSLSRSATPSTSSNGRPSSPSSLPSSPSALSALGPGSTPPATTLTPAPQQPYRDPRPCISAYFAISCASATGTSQTRFSSSPDLFSVSQSWGWKSSTLRTEDFLEVGSQSLPNHTSIRDERVSFRATVLLGLV